MQSLHLSVIMPMAQKHHPPHLLQRYQFIISVVLALTATGLVVYFKGEKEKLMAQRKRQERDSIRALGRPHIGQPFRLLNVNEKRVMSSEELMEGQFTMIYFGFTHCPDICPEELDKMAEVTDAVKAEFGEGILRPVFITCDPLRDTEEVVREYVEDFHPDLVGFTGPADELKKVARSYRVYAYTPPNVSPEDDYLVDHSIFIYLMDPKGRFVDCYARDTTTQYVFESFKNYMQDYLADGGKLKNYPKEQSI
ncbi:Protein sco1 [Choanephora cucurbitarum]|uniref:Protein sco1 n=1 Tax=Choanephora cucurbitarum TaxID=101091 RepID=A0A1C7MVP2_9FUNG|nr:Protein sco1 [Choanephora cucurbitarum]